MQRKDGKPKVYSSKKCDKCNNAISRLAFNRHYSTCNGNWKRKQNSNFDISTCIKNGNNYQCPICNKIFTIKGIGGHYWRVHTEEGKSFDPNRYAILKHRIAWNKGLTKETSEIIKKSAELLKGRPGPILSEESLKRKSKNTSDTIKLKVEKGEWHTSIAKKMLKVYKGETLHGSWEYEYAKYLDSKNIVWVRNKKSFPYKHEGKDRRYTPDFYLEETKEFIEIKGFKTKLDDSKWGYFPKEEVLKVLFKEDLIKLGVRNIK